jgi:two-component system, OmpR family, sensor histidine kinase KdpD
MMRRKGGAMPRGALRIYLGAAPGVGKTVAMLDEGARRSCRGTDVVVACVDTRGRRYTEERLAGLPAMSGQPQALDVAGVIARRPAVALVDDLAYRNEAGTGGNQWRWQHVEEVLAAGIDVITNVNVDELESLSDVVVQITGRRPAGSVPDAFVRGADQVELVDMAPEALRRRMAHGHIYPPERIDAALGDYFRIGNLAALRELALLWLADSIDSGLRRYRAEHGISARWETKERIVVGLTGGAMDDRLIRRAARLASRMSGGELLAVHVARSEALSEPGVAALAAHRLLVESLGGSYHSVVGDDVAGALLAFARRVDATQIVLGRPVRRGRFGLRGRSGIGARVVQDFGEIDVHVVTHDVPGTSGPALPRITGGLTARRQVGGLIAAAVLLPLVTWLCTSVRGQLDFAADVPLYLFVVVITSTIGGFYPALVSAVAASLLLNYFFTAPYHTFTIDRASNVVALVIFLLIATLVSQVVDLAARRSAVAARAGAEAETLSTFAGSLLRGEQALPALLDRVRETFAMSAVAVLQPDNATRGWTVVASAGADAPSAPGDADAATSVGADLVLVLRGHPLPAGDQRVLAAFAAHVAVAYRQQQLVEAARAAEPLAESDRQRTALLNAVSHDLRTPIASAKAAVSSLRTSDVPWTAEQRAELLETAEDALDRLTDLVTNLLDLSRLQAGALPVATTSVGLDDVVATALGHAGTADRIEVDVPDDLPEVIADAGLLERVIANVVQNALRYAPPPTRVRIAGSAHLNRVELRVIDRGPGIDVKQLDRIFRPFQRTDDAPSNGAGVGLGLAIARGFAEAMGGEVTAEPTPGGGATVVISLTSARSAT